MNRDLVNILWTARWHTTKGDSAGAIKWITNALEHIGAEKPTGTIHVSFYESAKKKAISEFMWTARWAARNNKLNVAHFQITHALVYIGAEKTGDVKSEPIITPINPPSVPDPTAKKGLNIIPFAKQLPNKMKVKGRYAKKYPSTLLLHFSAGRWRTLKDAENMMEYGRKQGYAYLGCAHDGTLLQAHDVNQWGNHAGTSGKFLGSIPFVGTVSDETIGIEVLNPGLLKERKDGRLEAYFGEIFERDQCRYVLQKEYGCPTGWYLPFSRAQEQTVIKTALWLYDNDPYGVFSLDVVGHHEVSGVPGLGYWRKNDPGGALSMPMADFRKMLKAMR